MEQNYPMNPNQTYFENTGFQNNRTKKQLLLLDVISNGGTKLKDFNLILPEPLIIDKLSDIYLDSITTVGAISKPDYKSENTSKNMGFRLKINEFKIQSKIATNILETITVDGNDIVSTNINNTIYIPNDTPLDSDTAKHHSTTHKGKKLNYICSMNPTRISEISGNITDMGTKHSGTTNFSDPAKPIVYASPFHTPSNTKPNRFIAEFVIVQRE